MFLNIISKLQKWFIRGTRSQLPIDDLETPLVLR